MTVNKKKRHAVNSKALLLALLTLPGVVLPARAFTLTPENVVPFVYKNLKGLTLETILLHSRGPEQKRLKATLDAVSKNRKAYLQLRLQSQEMEGFEVRVSEIYKTVACVYYYWKVRKTIPADASGKLQTSTTVKVPYKTLLRKIDGRWYIVSTREAFFTDEIGPQDYRRKMQDKQRKDKQKPPGKSGDL